ncbi:MAG TPA: hypothetical protein VMU50_05245, partial [Polyangia bacterium]|nr:hypothetical protein [Polyangia bacterium]
MRASAFSLRLAALAAVTSAIACASSARVGEIPGGGGQNSGTGGSAPIAGGGGGGSGGGQGTSGGGSGGAASVTGGGGSGAGSVPTAPVMAVKGPDVTFTEFAIKDGGPMTASPGGICAGADGRIWYLHQNTGPSANGAVDINGG